jgi:hypothetical protein
VIALGGSHDPARVCCVVERNWGPRSIAGS